MICTGREHEKGGAESSKATAGPGRKNKGKGGKEKKKTTGSKSKEKKKKPDPSDDDTGKEKEKERRKKKKVKRRKVKVSSDSSDDDTSSSSSETSSEEGTSSSSDEEDSSSSNGSGKGRRRTKKKRKTVDMELLEELWPVEDRPLKLQKSKGIGNLSMSKLMRLKEQFEKEAEKKGLGAAVYGRDKKPRTKKFKAMKDDGETRLHPARFESLPWAEPAKYWQMVPTSRTEIFRHLPLEHIGVEGVPETTIVKLHNRKVPVDLGMLYREVTEVRHVQVAVYNYVALLRSLHPADHGALAILSVLTHAGWADGIGDSDKQRVQIMKKFFDDTVRENSGRAVRKEPPLDPEQGRARWLKAVAAVLPHLSLLGVGQQLAAMGTPGSAKQQKKNKGQGGGGGGGAQHSGGSGQGGGGSNSGQQGGKLTTGGNRGGGQAGGGPVRVPARFNGMPVCFGFNGASGCTRLPAGSTAANCMDGNTRFAHVCNYFTKATGGHCLANHSKHGNH